jgi:RNA polymerase sigma factor (sigma-70 family)
VESFEQLANQYQLMIHKIIHSLHIYKNQEEFYQTALIGLWEAKERFDPEKGTFTNYAYTYIKGKLQTEMKRTNTWELRNVYPKEEYWEAIEDQDSSQPLEVELLLSYCHDLKEKEKKWVLDACLGFLSVREIAEKENVSVSAVKLWRSGALKKLRGQLEIRE